MNCPGNYLMQKRKYGTIPSVNVCCARMISAQSGVEFTSSDYNGIRKVYSSWLCMNAPRKIGNAISTYSLCKQEI